MELRQADAEEDEWPRVKSSKMPQCVAAFAATLMSFCGGTSVTWYQYNLGTLYDEGDLSGYQRSKFTFLPYVSAALGAPLAGLLLHWRGRRMTHLLLGVPFAVSYLMLLVLRASSSWLAIPLLLVGLSLGGVFVTSPVYLAEIAEDSVRGRLTCLHQVMFSGGVLFMDLLSLAESYVVMCASCLVVSVLATAFFFCMPETPYYHLLQNRKQEAKSSLQWLRGSQCRVGEELHSMQAFVYESRQGGNASTDRPFFKPLAICLILLTFQLFNSYSCEFLLANIKILLYGRVIPLNVISLIITTVMLVITFVGSLLTDWLGRRIPLIISSLVMAVSLVVVAISHMMDTQPYQYLQWSWPSLVSMFMFTIAYSSCIALPWTLVAELMPLNEKSIVGSLTSSLYWLFAVLAYISFVTALSFVESHLYFWLVSFFCLTEAVFVYFFLPETKCKPLYAIQYDLAKRNKGRIISARVEDANTGI